MIAPFIDATGASRPTAAEMLAAMHQETGRRWVPGWTDTHPQALEPLDLERDDVASGEVWPDCPHLEIVQEGDLLAYVCAECLAPVPYHPPGEP